MKFILPALVITFSFIPSISFSAKMNANQLYDEGVKYFNEKKYEKSNELFSLAINDGLSGDKLKDTHVKLKIIKIDKIDKIDKINDNVQFSIPFELNGQNYHNKITELCVEEYDYKNVITYKKYIDLVSSGKPENNFNSVYRVYENGYGILPYTELKVAGNFLYKEIIIYKKDKHVDYKLYDIDHNKINELWPLEIGKKIDLNTNEKHYQKYNNVETPDTFNDKIFNGSIKINKITNINSKLFGMVKVFEIIKEVNAVGKQINIENNKKIPKEITQHVITTYYFSPILSLSVKHVVNIELKIKNLLDLKEENKKIINTCETSGIF